MAKKQTIVIPIADTKGSADALKILQTNVKLLRNQLAGLEKGTDEYNKVLAELAENQKIINQVTQETRIATLNLTQVFQQTTRAVRGVVGIFGSLNAALSLFGVESEEVGQALVKLQAFQSLIISLTAVTNGIRAATIAWRGLKTAIGANPFGFIIAGIAAVGAGLSALRNWLESNRQRVDELKDSYDNLAQSIQNNNEQLSLQVRLAQAAEKSEQDIIDIRRQSNEAQLNELNAFINEYTKEYERLTDIPPKLRKKSANDEIEILRENLENARNLLESAQKEQTRIANDTLVLQEKNRTSERKKLEAEQQAEIKAQQDRDKKVAEERIKNAQTIANAITEIERNAANERLKSYSVDEIANLAKQQQTIVNNLQISIQNANLTDRERLEAIKELKVQEAQLNTILSTQKTIVDANNNAIREANEAREIRIAQTRELFILEGQSDELLRQYNQTIEELNLNEAQRLVNESQRIQQSIENNRLEIEILRERLNEEGITNEQRIELTRAYNQALEEQLNLQNQLINNGNALTKVNLDNAEKEKNAAQALTDFKLQQASQLFTASSQILGEQTAAGKAAAVASATIDTYKAANSALANDGVGPARWAAFAAALATGLATVKKIFSVQVPNATTTGGISTEPMSMIPAFPESNTPIQETHNNLSAADELFFNQQKVYVLESDITEVQNKVKTAETETAF